MSIETGGNHEKRKKGEAPEVKITDVTGFLPRVIPESLFTKKELTDIDTGLDIIESRLEDMKNTGKGTIPPWEKSVDYSHLEILPPISKKPDAPPEKS